ncbi:hypothetical protein [Putridiphycobacter roseus]|uniref:hypothetical protein n=1 Tax=Putridiphycobacter roseus TaxID=2219161 RepID=UPI00131500F4|nr:hypothetical protein [Putridiphycobacter roseus]
MLAAVLLWGASCSPTAETKQVVLKKVERVVEEVSNVSNPLDLELNNGEKWLVDTEMHVGILNIKNQLANFQSKDLVDYQLLGDRVGDQIKIIRASDTMKGQAHQEFHKLLQPFLELKDALVMATSVAEGKALVINIKAEIQTFYTYFQSK